jgi:trimethylamine--corrinoid protein Co-methyltransferase
MGAIETMMIDIGYVEVGKTLGLPTHAYMGLSDAKCVDAQAGLESGIGAILAALAGVNVVSGAGMMDYENCQSPEKLVIDNEICRMAYRLIDGVLQRDEPMAFPILEDALGGADFLSHPHTVQWHRREHGQPSVIDRGNAQQWAEAGRPTLADRAAVHAARLLSGEEPPPADSLREELTRIMKAHAQRLGV